MLRLASKRWSGRTASPARRQRRGRLSAAQFYATNPAKTYRFRASLRPRIRVDNDGEERSESARQEQQGGQERGEDGQGQGPDEGGRRRLDRRQEQEVRGTCRPEEGQGQGEKRRRERPLEVETGA